MRFTMREIMTGCLIKSEKNVRREREKGGGGGGGLRETWSETDRGTEIKKKVRQRQTERYMK